MPYEWTRPPPDVSPPGPQARLALWPYRSLPKRGFVWFIGGSAALIALPLIPFLGNPVFWGLLPFMLVVIGGLWAALNRSYRDGAVLEELALWPDRIEVIRHNPRGPKQVWSANPYWVEIALHETGGPVPQYLTLKGAGREVELGAFLSEAERVALTSELRAALALAR